MFNRGTAAAGWAVPTAADVAFTLGILALLGRRIPVRPARVRRRAGGGARAYAAWPCAVVTVALALFLHVAGVHAALAGIILAVFLPTRPTPTAGPLLAQAATALAELEHAKHELKSRRAPVPGVGQEPMWDWASRNPSAASEKPLSPADRIEAAVAPWTAYLILPLFAFSAAGVDLHINVWSPTTRSFFSGSCSDWSSGSRLESQSHRGLRSG